MLTDGQTLQVIYLSMSHDHTNVETWAVALFFLLVDEQVNGRSVLWKLAVQWELELFPLKKFVVKPV